MTLIKTYIVQTAILFTAGLVAQLASAHYPFVALLAYQTFNNQTAIISGFYDNPFASEVAIKNFNFHFHTPSGEKVQINEQDWQKTQAVAVYSLSNKVDGTYRIRGEKKGGIAQFTQVNQQWKPLVSAQPKQGALKNDNVVYTIDLKKNAVVKQVQTLEIVETFVSRRVVSDHVIHHIHDGFDVQFLTHPNQMKVDQNINLKVLDDKKGIENLKVEILAPTTDFSREEKVYQVEQTDQSGNLQFKLTEKGQYLLKIDYQQPFSKPSNDLKRYKYTLAFNVVD